MRIIKCHITNFGCYSDKTFDFSTKLNSFFLNNGEGKTTLATFIKAMLYSLEKNSKTSYERKHYKPYSGGIYGGSLEIELDSKKYRIERTFEDSPKKDTLKIYNELGEPQSVFLSKPLSMLQGEDSSQLGELILGIDADAFLRCNFISSNDLSFSSNESIKMKIGNIVIDKERENSYEDTYDSIVSFDLRDKEPTKNNENAYPFRIKKLKKENLDKQKEIAELEKLENDLPKLYSEIQEKKDELVLIEKKQNELSFMHTQKGKLSTVQQYEKDINEQNRIIGDITKKYNDNIPSKLEIDNLIENLENYNECVTIDKTYNITPADISRLEELDGKVISADDYELLADANSKLSGSINDNSLVQIDETRFNELKNKFEGKTLKKEIELDEEILEFRGLERDEKDFALNYYGTDIDYPSENVLEHIQKEIETYNKLLKETNDAKSSYKEPVLFIKIVLAIITFGIFMIILNKKKKECQKFVNEKENAVNNVALNLNEFFSKYNKNSGTYELRLAELRDEINNYASAATENESKKKKHDKLLEKYNEKKLFLEKYFIIFGYEKSDINANYIQYKSDLADYVNLKKDDERNKKIYSGMERNISELNKSINSILSKYGIVRKDDFAKQLNEIKEIRSFFDKYNPIYINKKENDKSKMKFEEKIIAILKKHNIDYINDVALAANNVINDGTIFARAKEKKVECIEKKDRFIKENNLEGFVAENVEQAEEDLRKKHEMKTAEYNKKEETIIQIEDRISKKENIQDDINKNLELIEEYEEKVRIAELAKNALSSAQSDMEAKFVDPIKCSFVSYAKKIYEKIGTNIRMNYDYEIKYDVKGQLRESIDLSDGERTIMMLALRFAVLDSMYKDHDSLIILDDPFESLDSDKINKAINLIKELSNDWQIIYFTCHESRNI